jgi:hypothetical protein
MAERLEPHIGEYIVVNAYHELNRHPMWRRHVWGRFHRMEAGVDGAMRAGQCLLIGEHKVFAHNVISFMVLDADAVEELGLDGTLRT